MAERLPLNGETWCRKCPEPATHTRVVSIGGAPAERLPYCDQCAWIIQPRRTR